MTADSDHGPCPARRPQEPDPESPSIQSTSPRHLFQKHQGNDLEGPEVSSSNLYVSVHILHDWFFSETKLERRNQMAWRGERLLGFNIGLREGGKLDPPRENVQESTWGEDSWRHRS